jgi:hypothetical protein
MPSPFVAALRDMNRVLDVHMGEPATFTPRADGDFGAGEDQARPAFAAVVQVTETDPSAAQVEHTKTQVAYSEFAIEVRRLHLPAAYSVRKGDHIHLPERRLTLRINRIERDDPDVVACICGPITASDVPRSER